MKLRSPGIITTDYRDYLYIHLAVLLFGTAGLFGKFLNLSATVIVAGRTFWAAIILFLMGLSLLRRSSRVDRKILSTLFILGMLLAAHWLSFFKAIQLSTVAIGLLTYSSYPIFVTLITACIQRQRPRLQNLLALTLVIIGLYLIIPGKFPSSSFTRGALWGLAAGMTFAILTLYNRHLVQRVPALVITGGENCGAFLVLLPFVGSEILQLSLMDWGLLFLLGVFCTALAHWLFTRGLSSVSAEKASIIATLEPVYGSLFALLLLGETLTLKSIGGGCLILGASLMVTLHQPLLRPH